MEKPGQCVACKEHEAHFRARHLSQKSWNKIRPWTPQTIFSFMLNSWLSCPKWVKDANILWFLRNYSFLQTSIRQLYTAKKIRVKTLRKKSGKNSLIWDSGIPTLHSQVNVKTDKLNFSWTLVYSTPNFLGLDCSVGACSSVRKRIHQQRCFLMSLPSSHANAFFFTYTGADVPSAWRQDSKTCSFVPPSSMWPFPLKSSDHFSSFLSSTWFSKLQKAFSSLLFFGAI